MGILEEVFLHYFINESIKMLMKKYSTVQYMLLHLDNKAYKAFIYTFIRL